MSINEEGLTEFKTVGPMVLQHVCFYISGIANYLLTALSTWEQCIALMQVRSFPRIVRCFEEPGSVWYNLCVVKTFTLPVCIRLKVATIWQIQLAPKYNPNPIPLEASLVGYFTFLIFIARHKIVDVYGMIFLTFQGTTWFEVETERYGFEEMWYARPASTVKVQFPLFFGREGDLKKKVQSPLFALVGACSDSFLIFTASSQRGLSHHPASHMGHSFCREKIQEEKGKKRK